jgi:2-polyprenyl-6-methoxyphenol hydroxylase-like FAD-dependent oxidoreductase
MAEVVVCGGDIVGLTSAVLLARDGHEVTVLERDADDLPASVEDAWGVGSPGCRAVPAIAHRSTALPPVPRAGDADVLARVVAAGGTWVNFLPAAITERDPRPGDDRFRFITGRRPIIEHVHACAARDERGVTVRTGTKALGLLAAPNGDIPRVTAVDTDLGEPGADLVVDAMGRRSPLAEWLTASGPRPPLISSQDCGFTYYTRYYSGSEMPAIRAPLACPIGTFLIPDPAWGQPDVVEHPVGTVR